MRTPPSLPPGPRPNRLFGAASPYLRAHGHDPVDWFPWSDEAFERAKTLNKPVFLRPKTVTFCLREVKTPF